jgi:hypothetical protein
MDGSSAKPRGRLDRGQSNVHLVELEAIVLAWPIRRHNAVVIQDVVDESELLVCGYELPLFDEGHGTEGDECQARSEIPRLGCGVNPPDV